MFYATQLKCFEEFVQQRQNILCMSGAIENTHPLLNLRKAGGWPPVGFNLSLPGCLVHFLAYFGKVKDQMKKFPVLHMGEGVLSYLDNAQMNTPHFKKGLPLCKRGCEYLGQSIDPL